jgi:serine protease
VGSPASCTGAIAVSATDAQRNIARYSNTGTRIVVAAPGGDTSVTTTGNGAPDGVYSALGTFDSSGRRQPSFGAMAGTSMASPHVAGVMALMRFVNPGLTVAQVDNLFAAGALTDDLGATGRDNQFGFGLINARKAVDAALAALSAPPPVASAPIVALPSSLDFGAMATTAVLELSAAGATTEAVVGAPQVVVPAGTAAGAVAVTATAVNAVGLGRWTLTINRAAFSGNGTFYPSVRFTLNSGRFINVQLTVQKPAAAGGNAASNWGPVYVLLIDPATGKVEHTVLATFSGGRYSWSKTGYAKAKVSIIAGGDLDNDDIICQRGEPCGAYPVLPQRADLTVIDLSGNRSDLNFQVSPLAGISPAAAGGADAGPVFRRTTLDAASLAEGAQP